MFHLYIFKVIQLILTTLFIYYKSHKTFQICPKLAYTVKPVYKVQPWESQKGVVGHGWSVYGGFTNKIAIQIRLAGLSLAVGCYTEAATNTGLTVCGYLLNSLKLAIFINTNSCHTYHSWSSTSSKVKWNLRNIITLGQAKTDNTNQMITKTNYFYSFLLN